MSGGVDEHAPPCTRARAGAPGTDPAHEAHPDRWAWRRRVRANPHQHRVYRWVVGVAGLLLVLLGLATGWLPGPGGIPLVLAGLAVWASEFLWAHRLMLRLKHALHVYRGWTRRRKVLFWVALATVCVLLGWCYLAVVGPPGWLPVEVDRVLAHLPGVDIPA